jgi:hypothetical protein
VNRAGRGLCARLAPSSSRLFESHVCGQPALLSSRVRLAILFSLLGVTCGLHSLLALMSGCMGRSCTAN